MGERPAHSTSTTATATQNAGKADSPDLYPSSSGPSGDNLFGASSSDTIVNGSSGQDKADKARVSVGSQGHSSVTPLDPGILGIPNIFRCETVRTLTQFSHECSECASESEERV